MPETESIFSDATIKWAGVIDLGLFYKKIQIWLETKKYKTKEIKYVEKIKPNGKQIEITWESKREEGKFIGDKPYFRFDLRTTFFLVGVSDSEIEKDGRKLKLSKIDAEVKVSTDFTKDAESVFKEHPFMKKIYEKYVIKHKIEEAKIDCYKDASDYMEELKNYFNLYQFK